MEAAGDHDLLRLSLPTFLNFFHRQDPLGGHTTRPWDARRRCFDFVDTCLAKTLHTNSLGRWRNCSGGLGIQLC